jgi:hypothetical protein
MRQILQNKLTIVTFFFVAIYIFGCTPTMVIVPDAAHDRKPVITIHSLPSGSGQVSPGEVSITTGKPVGVTENTTVVITADAVNSGGVKSLWIAGYHGGNKLWEVTVASVPNAQNKVPTTLSIIGHNGQGGIGSNPLLIVLNHLYETADVKAEATNFNNQTEKLQVNYEVLPANLIE